MTGSAPAINYKQDTKGKKMEVLRVFDTIDKLNDEYVNIWEEICNIESPSEDKARVDVVGDYLSSIAKGLGFKIERHKEKSFGDVITLIMNPEAKGKPIALSGHMDTVHPIGLFGTPPVHRDEERIYGPGVMDCKGGIVAGILAMHALSINGFADRPIMMLLQSNEEIGSGKDNKGPIRYICERAKESVAFLNLEGHEGYFDGKACLSRKGIVGFIFKVYGICAHSSYCAREGASAIREASHKILALEEYKCDEGITFNVGTIRGGTVRNTVPGYCEFELDCRFTRGEDLEKIKAIVEDIAKMTHIDGCSCEVALINYRPPMELCERNKTLLALANEAFIKYGLSPLDIGFKNGGSDAADVTAYGIPCIDSIGVKGERAHSKEEYAIISSLSESAKRIVAIISSL